MKGSKTTWVIFGVALLALSGGALYTAWPVLFPRTAVALVADPECDLRAGPCEMWLPSGGRLAFAIEPRTLPQMQPLDIRVELQGARVSGVEVDFSGVGMNMGFNRPALKSAGNGAYTGQTRLPVCIRQAMEWEARVLLHTDRGLVSAPFRFITVKQGALGRESS